MEFALITIVKLFCLLFTYLKSRGKSRGQQLFKNEHTILKSEIRNYLQTRT